MMEVLRILGYLALLAFGIFFFDVRNDISRNPGIQVFIGITFFMSTVFFLVRGFVRLHPDNLIKLTFLVLIATLLGLNFLRILLGHAFGAGVLS